MIVRELITRLGFSLDQSKLTKAEVATKRLKTQADQAARAFRSIFAGYIGFQAIRSISDIGDEMQGMRVRISQLPQTLGDVGKAVDVVTARATASGAKLEAYSRLYTRVGFAAKDYITTQEDLLLITDTFSKALAVGGTSTQEGAAVMTQFSQALASGVLQGDEFRSMAEAAPQFLDKLSETLKIPRTELKKMASEGKLTARSVIEATRDMSDYFAKRFDEIPRSVGRAMIIMGNRFALGIDKLNRKTQFISKIANAFIRAFDVVEGAVTSLIDSFGGLENTLRFLGIAIGVALGAKTLTILYAFRNASMAALLPWAGWIALIAGLSLVIEDLYVWIKGGESVLGNMIGPWTEWSEHILGAINKVWDVFKGFGKFLAGINALLVGTLTGDIALLKQGLIGIGEVLLPAADGGAASHAAAMANGVTPGQFAVPRMGQGIFGGGIHNNTEVSVVVPAGTTAEQADFLKRTAQKTFQTEALGRFASELSTYSN